MAKDAIELEGEVTHTGAGEIFHIKTPSHVVIAKLSGKMRKNHIHIVVGDKVKVEVSPYDATRGRITFRYK